MSKKGLLAVSFGTSYPETRKKTIDQINFDLNAAFAKRSFYTAFSSRFIVKKLRAQGDPILSVEEAMDKAAEDGITDLLIQPSHLMRAQEYDRLCEVVKVRASQFEEVRLGLPLLSSETDLQEIADAIPSMYPMITEEGTQLILMGHGTEHAYHSIYGQLETLLRERFPNLHIGTVEASEGVDAMLTELRTMDRASVKKVVLAPFLIVAGDHAVNDMASDEPTSWKSRLAAEGYHVECLLKGLGEFPEIRRMFVRHAKEAEKRA